MSKGRRECATITFWVQEHREEGEEGAEVYSEEGRKDLQGSLYRTTNKYGCK